MRLLSLRLRNFPSFHSVDRLKNNTHTVLVEQLEKKKYSPFEILRKIKTSDFGFSCTQLKKLVLKVVVNLKLN